MNKLQQFFVFFFQTEASDISYAVCAGINWKENVIYILFAS